MKIVKAVVKIVGIIATVLSFIPGPHQPIAMAVAAGAAALSATLEVIAPMKAKANARGSPTEYRLDPQTGIPMMLGRTQYAGTCIKRETWGKDNKYQCFTSVYSLGPINAIQSFTADRAVINFDGSGNAIGQLSGNMWFKSQLGAHPSPVLVSPVAGLPNWGANAKLSGLAASHWVIMFNKDGEFYSNGPPVPGIVAQGVKVYDPRLDSTYPGGSGACRALDESTYVYSETPHLHALTFALGRWQNGKRRFGIGFPVDGIDVPYFVNAANVDEANNWKVSGIIFSNDNKWNALKQIMEAGGGQPMTLGGKLSGVQSAPRVSIATIGSEEVVGRCSVVGTQTQRDRVNGIIPRYRSEAHGWEVISADVVRVPAYVADDGGERTKELEWFLVNQLQQASQLSAYHIYNAREFGPIELTLKIRWIGLKPGDCCLINIPELNLNNQRAVVLQRRFDVESGAVTLTFRSETNDKHAVALALSGAAPPAPSLTYNADELPAAPVAGNWTLTTGGLTSGSGTVPSLRFIGAMDNDTADGIEFSYRKVGSPTWILSALTGPETTVVDEPAVEPGASYEGRVRYTGAGKWSNSLVIGPQAVASSVSASAVIANAIVGQGALATASSADWSTQVSGTGKPESNATGGTNAVVNSNFVDAGVGYAADPGFTRVALPAGSPAPYGLQTTVTAGYSSAQLPVPPNSGRLWAGWSMRQLAPVGGFATGGVIFYDAAFGVVGSVGIPGLTFSPGVAGQWSTNIGGWITVPANAAYFLIWATPQPSGGGAFQITKPIVQGNEPSSTVGADINLNVVDSFTGSPVTLPRNEIKTSLGTAAAIAGQAPAATDNTIEGGATVDANIVVDNPVIIYAHATGTPKTGEISKVVAAKLRRNGVDLTTGVTWTAALVSGNATFTIGGTGTGTLTITGPNDATLAPESAIRLNAAAGVQRSVFVKVMRIDDPPTNSGGGGGNPGTTASTSTLGAATSTSYGAGESDILKCKAGTAGQVACTAPISYKRTPGTANGLTAANGKWQWRVVGGVFADITTEITGSDAETIVAAGEPTFNRSGSINCAMTKTGLTSGTEYEFKFLWRKVDTSGDVDDIYRVSGTMQAAGS